MKVKSSILLSILSCLLLITVAGCSSKIKNSTINNIHLGMSKETVIEKLGKPQKMYSIKENKKKKEILRYEVQPRDIEHKDRAKRIVSQICMCVFTFGLWIPMAFVTESLFNYNPHWFIFSNNKLIKSVDSFAMTIQVIES